MRGVIFVSSLALVLCACTGYERGARSPAELIDAYIHALQNRDEAALSRLIPNDHDAAAEVHQRIKDLAHPTIFHVAVDLRFSLDSSDHVTAVLDGRFLDQGGGEQPFHADESIVQMNGRWYLILGHVRS